ncbi:selenide, water dikinase SelD [Lutimaribacter marinistellae]|uniref:Selenide, water dikinase SelD n=1 Tax=Lutimaribacter marinistellae TaxID=1820329 RepID=A0ABV7TMQ9_9RHOB
MRHAPLPLTRDLVLVGGGHTHALVLRKWGMNPLPGVRVTVVTPGPTAPYSGMLPGFVAGHYAREALDIDLVRLARFAGARVVLAEADGIDLAQRQICVSGRPPIGFDVVSINVGITSDMPRLPGFAEHAVPAKPLGPFASAWENYLSGSGPAKVAIIGGGVAGVELSMAMAHALRERGREAIVTIVDAGTALPGLGQSAEKRMRAALDRLGVVLLENRKVTSVSTKGVETDQGLIEADFITGAAGARPYPWITNSALELEQGFITVGPTLQSSDTHVFAAGDCAYLSHEPRPKAGVYAVREAPILFENLRAALGGSSLRSYRPQKDYLKLISLGRKSALAERFGLTLSGPHMWQWKDRIDRKFMDQFRDLPRMEPPPLPRHHAAGMAEALGEKPMCGGCGAKVGRNALQAALASRPPPARDDISALPGDDAALLRTGGARQVISTDHLRSVCEDPFVMTRIAAVHALGDIWAMGADPQAATVSIILPRMTPELQERTMAEIMAAADETLRGAGAEIVGGHSSMGDEMTIGFTVTGLLQRDPITLSGAQAGDTLILTKPLGSGVLMAAEMAGAAQGADVTAAYALMTQAQAKAARILKDAHAMTDVTGFGLAGHLDGICKASGCGSTLDLDAIPLMQGAEALAEAGTRSTIFGENRMLAPDLPQGGKADLLFDPQTAGGLLAAIAPESVEDVLQGLTEAGYAAARIGEITTGSGVRLKR